MNLFDFYIICLDNAYNNARSKITRDQVYCVMKLKKYLAFAVALAVFSGCTISEYELQIYKNTEGKANVQINLAIKEGQALFMEEAARRYNEDNPNVSINIKRLEDSAGYNEQLVSLMHSEEIPTAFSVDGQYELSYWQDSIQPISENWLYDASEVITDPIKLNGEFLAVPVELSASGIIYNANLLDNFGVDYSNIGSLSELQEIITQIQENMNDTTLSTAVCQYGDFEDIIISGLDPENPDTLEIKEEILDIIELCGKNQSETTDIEMLANLKAAIYIGSSDIIKEVYTLNEDIAKALKIAPIERGGKSRYIVDASYLAINSQASNSQKDTLMDFFYWLYYYSKSILKEYNAVSPYTGSGVTQAQRTIFHSSFNSDKTEISKGFYAPTGWRDCFVREIQEFQSKALSRDGIIEKLNTQLSKLYRF